MNIVAAGALYLRRGRSCASGAKAISLMARTATILAVTPIIIGAAYGAQSLCPCGKILQSSSGGDAKPLTWEFTATEKRSGSADQSRRICYFKVVTNHSSDEVRDVSWKVAHYEREFISAGHSEHACVELPGEIKAIADNGPLHYAISSQSYETNVWPPQSGWVAQRTEAPQSATSFEPLLAEFTFETRTKRNGVQESRILIYSAAAYDDNKKSGFLTLSVENEGRASVAIFANFPDSVKYFSTPEKSPQIPAGGKKTLQISVFEKPEVKPTTVLFFNEDGNLVAKETAGLYVPAKGVVKFSDQELWER